jgi:hypothetical protein
MKQETEWKGMHNGNVKGKNFESGRRNRKTHNERLANIVSKEIENRKK